MSDHEFQDLIYEKPKLSIDNIKPIVQRNMMEESKHDNIQVDFVSNDNSNVIKRRGRPKGSKNKPK